MLHAARNGYLLLFWGSTLDAPQPCRLNLTGLLLLLAVFLTHHLGLSTNLSDRQPSSNTCPKPSYDYTIRDTPNKCLGPDFLEICDLHDAKGRMRKLENYEFKYCDKFKLFNALNPRDPDCNLDNISPDGCKQCLQRLQELDFKAYASYKEFRNVIRQFDCEATFSSQSNCTECELAYKDWTCSLSIPYYDVTTKEAVLPCSDYCQHVEERCPYFLPHMDQQYAGEPSFLCTVPYIPHQASNLSVARQCHKLSADDITLQPLGDSFSTSISPEQQQQQQQQHATKVDAQTSDDTSIAASTASSSAGSSLSATSRSGRTFRYHVVTLLLVAQLACQWYYRTIESYILYRVIGFT